MSDFSALDSAAPADRQLHISGIYRKFESPTNTARDTSSTRALAVRVAGATSVDDRDK
jgi:hypothetical protein